MRSFYEVRLAPLIADLSAVVVSLGLLSVSIGYVNAVITDPAVVQDLRFWIRVLVLMATVAFTSYYLLAYVVEMKQDDGDTNWAGGSMSPVRIIVLFALDLLMLAEQGWMYGILVLRDVTDANGDGNPLDMSAIHFMMLAGFAASWHLSAFVWHRLARSRRPSLYVHLGFFGYFALLTTIATIDGWMDSLAAQFIWSLAFLGAIVVLFFGRARNLVRNALIAHHGVTPN